MRLQLSRDRYSGRARRVRSRPTGYRVDRRPRFRDTKTSFKAFAGRIVALRIFRDGDFGKALGAVIGSVKLRTEVTQIESGIDCLVPPIEEHHRDRIAGKARACHFPIPRRAALENEKPFAGPSMSGWVMFSLLTTLASRNILPGQDGVAQAQAIDNELAAHENRDVLAETALLIENVARRRGFSSNTQDNASATVLASTATSGQSRKR